MADVVKWTELFGQPGDAGCRQADLTAVIDPAGAYTARSAEDVRDAVDDARQAGGGLSSVRP